MKETIQDSTACLLPFERKIVSVVFAFRDSKFKEHNSSDNHFLSHIKMFQFEITE